MLRLVRTLGPGFVASLLLLATPPLAAADSMRQPDGSHIVGASTKRMSRVYDSQSKSQWCWAACIQMLFAHHGLDLSQASIVRQTYGQDPYGNLPDWAGSFRAITANLNYAGQDGKGRSFSVSARLGSGAPAPAALVRELRAGRPVMVGYQNGPSSGHAVLITAARYTGSSTAPLVTDLVLRDPYPYPGSDRSQRGRRVVPGAQLASRMSAHWIVRISGGEGVPTPLADRFTSLRSQRSELEQTIAALEQQRMAAAAREMQIQQELGSLSMHRAGWLQTLQGIDARIRQLQVAGAQTDQRAALLQQQLGMVHPQSPQAFQIRQDLVGLSQQRAQINAQGQVALQNRATTVANLQQIEALGAQRVQYGNQVAMYRDRVRAEQDRLRSIQASMRAMSREFEGIPGFP